MKKSSIFILVSLFLLSGCKKTIENVGEDLVIQAMTNGQWVLTRFTQNGTDITSSFSAYKFQYHKNRTVDAIKNGMVERTGNWDANAADRTTWANFSGAPDPIGLINGTWKITNNSWTFVEGTQTNGTEIKTLRLDKL